MCGVVLIGVDLLPALFVVVVWYVRTVDLCAVGGNLSTFINFYKSAAPVRRPHDMAAAGDGLPASLTTVATSTDWLVSSARTGGLDQRCGR